MTAADEELDDAPEDSVVIVGFDEDLEDVREYPPDPDGPRRGEIVNFDGVAARVVADYGDGWGVLVMIGDDGRHRVCLEDYEPVARRDYCGECGQIGCAHDGLDREEEDETDDCT